MSSDSLTEDVKKTFFKGRFQVPERADMISKANEESIRVLSSTYVPKYINNIPLLQQEIIDVDRVSPIFREQGEIDLIPLYIEAVGVLITSVDENDNTELEVLEADVVSITDSILLKVPSNEVDKSRLHIEYAIGFYGLNSLRNEIPNFMQTYGMFTCGEPVRYGDQFRSGICDPSELSTRYLVIENIRESETSARFVQDKTFRVVCGLLLQVYLALMFARERVKFAHYDLHADNVLVTEYEEAVNISYRINGREHIVSTPFIATIIDFGRSMVTVDGNVISGSDIMSEEFGPYPEPRIELDMYRFFMSCVGNSRRKKKYQELYELFGGTGSVISALEDQATSYYQYPDRELDIYAIILYLQSNCKEYKYIPTNTWKPTKYRNRSIRPITTTLEYFESLPDGKDADIDEDLILNSSQDDLVTRYNAIRSMEDPTEKYYESRKYVTLAKLHITFVENRGINEDGFCKYLRDVIRVSRVKEMKNIELFNKKNRSGTDYSNYANRDRSINIG